MKTQVAILKCADYSPISVSQTLERIFSLLGGIEKFIKPKAKVFLKPNLLSATSPEEGVTTNPVIVKEVAKRIKDMGAKVVIGDSPGGGISIEDVYAKTGMEKISKELGIALIKFDKIRKVNNCPLIEIVFECDCFVSLPKFKTHSLTVITGGIKNSFGLVPGIYKTELHRKFPRPREFSKVLVDVFSLRKPDLIIIDGVVSMEGEGPAAGSLRNTGLLLASTDAVALDSILARIIGLNPGDVPIISEAYRRNLGEMDLEKIEVMGEPWGSVFIEDFQLPHQTVLNILPRGVLNFATHFMNNYPEVNNRTCRKCGVCVKGCPVEAITIENGVTKINHKLCVKCLCCFEFCPHKAIYLKKSLALKILDLVRR
ncbi:MAG: DUF362 domain-containing protein [Candidatus Omnitrophota bacterium]